MQNILTVLTGYLGKISLPGLGVIDIIEIRLISFFVSVYGLDQIYKSIYIAEGYSGSSRFHSDRLYIQDEYDPVDLPQSGQCAGDRCDRNFSAGIEKSAGTAGTEKNRINHHSI